MKTKTIRWYSPTFQACLFAMVFCSALILGGCGGSGGGNGNGNDDDGPFLGGEGAGADNIVTFWRYLGEYDADSFGVNHAVDIADDEGFFTAGFQDRFEGNIPRGEPSYFIARTDERGIVDWRITSGQAKEVIYDIRKTPDGGAVAVGYTESGAARQALAVKVGRNGNIEWEKLFTGDAAGAHTARAVCALANGYAIAGQAGDDLWFFRINPAGEKVDGSERIVQQAGWSAAYSMDRTEDGGFILAGVRNLGNRPETGFYVLRLDNDGSTMWQRSFGTGTAYSIRSLGSAGMIAAGSTGIFEDNTSNARIIRMNADGDEIWSHEFGGDYMDILYSVDVTGQNEFVAAGVTRSYSGYGAPGLEDYAREDFFMVKIAADGETIWRKVKGKGPNNSEIAYAIRVAPDGGFVLAGGGPNILAKFDRNGDTINIGDLDFTYTIPEDGAGLINQGNYLKVASAAGNALFLPFEVGAFALDRIIDALSGIPVGDLCDGGGEYRWDITPGGTVSAGDQYTATFDYCFMGTGPDRTGINGSIRIDVKDISGALTGDEYTIETRIAPDSVMIVEDGEVFVITGWFDYSRSSDGTGHKETTAIETGENAFRYYIQSARRTISQMAFSSIRAAAGGFSIGAPDERAEIRIDEADGTLSVTVEEAVAGSLVDEPDSGKIRVAAQDGSNLVITFDNGYATIDVDSDGDQVINISHTILWMEID